MAKESKLRFHEANRTDKCDLCGENATGMGVVLGTTDHLGVVVVCPKCFVTFIREFADAAIN